MIKDNFKHIYFIGIGGIGMSALARYFLSIGKEVLGYDKTPTQITQGLEKLGINIHYNSDVSKIPTNIENTLVIYTPAIPSDFEELVFVQQSEYTLMKRSEVLGLIANDQKCIAIAGTHGKTSITALSSHILKQSSMDTTAFIGGILLNYDSNYILPDKDTDNVVVEADEFDRSFLKLTPSIALISSTDADHLDIYGNEKELQDSFIQFTQKIKTGGALIVKKEFSSFFNESNHRMYTYSLNNADFYPQNIKIENGSYVFDLVTPFSIITNLEFHCPGKLNLENAVAASAVAIVSGIDSGELHDALKIYKGVKRRLELKYQYSDCYYFDDYAHHPTELRATINAIKELFPNQPITGIFQPHLYSRTRDFQEEFAKSLDLLDEVMLLDIYPARELPIEGVSSKIILDRMKSLDKQIVEPKQVLKRLRERGVKILLTLGAGDIDKLVEPICKTLRKRNEVC